MYGHDSLFDPPAKPSLPAGAAELLPGIELGSLLSSVDSSSLSRYERVQLISAYQRMVSHYQSRFYQEIARLYAQELSEDPEAPVEDSAWAVRTELGAALRLSSRSAQLAFDLALALERAEAVSEALSRGSLDLYRAEVLIRHSCHLPDPDLAWVIDQVLVEAPGLTASQIRVRTQRLCYLASPEEARLRYGEAVGNRYVEVRGSEFGTATLEGRDLPPERAEAAYRHLKRLARKLKRKGDPRTIDQLMADLFLEQLLGESEGKEGETRGGGVELRVDLETLSGLSEAPGELMGMGPVISDIARRVAREQTHCRWSFVVTDPETGMPVHTGTTRRRPREGTRRLVEAQNPTCVFPGCRRVSRDCDLDHRLPWAERGPSCECNLVPLCRRHHRCRHRLGWRHSPLPGGDHLWTSPLGHRYTTSGRPP